MRSPGMQKNPDYQLKMERMHQRVEVFIDNEKIAETLSAIKLLEEGHDPVIYIPKNDIVAVDFEKYDDYQCPYKGSGKLYTIKHGEQKHENAAWTYETPYDEVQELKGRVAFYPDRVQEIRISP